MQRTLHIVAVALIALGGAALLGVGMLRVVHAREFFERWDEISGSDAISAQGHRAALVGLGDKPIGFGLKHAMLAGLIALPAGVILLRVRAARAAAGSTDQPARS